MYMQRDTGRPFTFLHLPLLDANKKSLVHITSGLSLRESIYGCVLMILIELLTNYLQVRILFMEGSSLRQWHKVENLL